MSGPQKSKVQRVSRITDSRIAAQQDRRTVVTQDGAENYWRQKNYELVFAIERQIQIRRVYSLTIDYSLLIIDMVNAKFAEPTHSLLITHYSSFES